MSTSIYWKNKNKTTKQQKKKKKKKKKKNNVQLQDWLKLAKSKVLKDKKYMLLFRDGFKRPMHLIGLDESGY